MPKTISVEVLAVSSGFKLEGRRAEHGMPGNTLQKDQGREIARLLWTHLPNKTLDGILDYLRQEGEIAPS